MIKKIVLSTFIAFNVCYKITPAQGIYLGFLHSKNDLQKHNLKGKVKSYECSLYIVINKFGEISKGKNTGTGIVTFNEQGNIIDTTGSSYARRYKYDDKGYIIEESYFGGQNDERCIYKYNVNSKREEIICYALAGNIEVDGSMTNKYNFIYNDDKSITLEQQYFFFGNSIGKTIYKYDKRGNLIERKKYSPDGYLSYHYFFKYVYDVKGNIIRRDNFQGKRFSSKYTYKYDDKGNKIESNTYYPNGSLFYKYTYKYDDKSNKIESNSYSTDDRLDYKYTFKYKYDIKGNWIEKIELKDDIPIEISERKIEYY